MDGSLLPLWIALLTLILLSAYFSSTETAFSSFNHVRMKSMAQNGDKSAKLVLKISEDFDKLISTILIGNNIVNITATSISGLIFAELIKEEDLAVTVSTVFMTVIVLIFGEITPKSLAKQSAERFSMFSARILNALIIALTPLSIIFMKWQKVVTRLSIFPQTTR